MAIGFTPKHTEHFSHGLLPHQFLMLALHTCQELGWDVQYISQAGLIAYTRNGLLKFNAEFRMIVDQQQALLTSSSTGNEFFDLGKNKKTVKLFRDQFAEVMHTYPLPDIDQEYEQVSAQMISGPGDILRQPHPTGFDVFKDVLSVFKPSGDYFFTPVLLNLNLLMFIVMVISGVHIMEPGGNSLIMWGANYKPLTLSGQWWRLVSSCFIHIGVLHLLMNMYALLYIGLLLEPILGRFRFITAYLVTGIFGSLSSLWWHDLSISAGASGAIFGMYGVFLALLTTSIVEKSTRKPLFISIAVFVVYNLMSGIKEGVDNAAHIGGLASGIICGYLFLPALKQNGSQVYRYGSIFVAIAACAVTTVIALKKIPNPVARYDAIMEKMYHNDTSALSIYRISDSLSKDVKLQLISDKALKKTAENIRLMKELQTLDLPSPLKYRVSLFKAYFDMRSESYDIYYKAMAEESNEYDAQLNSIYGRIDSLNNLIIQHD